MNLHNPTKARARGPSGRKPPTRKGQDNKGGDEEGGKVKTILNQIKSSSEKQHPYSDQTVGKIDPADFDRVLFFCIPKHSELYCPTVQEPSDVLTNSAPQNNNILISTNQNIKEVPGKDGIEEQSETSELVEKRSKKLKLWKSCSLL